MVKLHLQVALGILFNQISPIYELFFYKLILRIPELNRMTTGAAFTAPKWIVTTDNKKRTPKTNLFFILLPPSSI